VATFNQTDTVGIYFVTQHVHSQQHNGAFAINLFDPLQSNLAPAAQLPVAHSTPFDAGNSTLPRALLELWPWIAAFLLLVLCAEWWLFGRNYTLPSISSVQSSAYKRAGGHLQQRQPRGRIATLWTGVMNRAPTTRYRNLTKRVTKTTKRLMRRLPGDLAARGERRPGKGLYGRDSSRPGMDTFTRVENQRLTGKQKAKGKNHANL
jgi:Ca-activated chloride channel family protein